MIYLKNVIEEYPECLENSEKLKMHLNYLYPSEKAKTNIIVTIFDSGIANEIKKLSSIDEKTILFFCDKLENEYGYSREFSKECLNIWVYAYNKKIIRIKVLT